MLPSIIHSYLPRCILYVLSIDYAYYANLRCVLMLWIYDTHSTCYALFILSISICDVCPRSTRYILPSLTDMIILSVVILYILSIYNTCYKCYRSIMHIHAIDLYASYVYSYHHDHHVLSLFRLCDPTPRPCTYPCLL